MCLAIPMKIIEISENIAVCDATGIQREVNIQLLQHCKLLIGDFVLVHLGYAIQKVPAPEAEASRTTYSAMLNENSNIS